MHAANLDVLFRGDEVQIASFQVFRKHELNAPAGEAGALATEAANAYREPFRRADSFELHEAAVGAALFFDVAERGDAPILEDEHFVAGLIDIAQQVRRDEKADAALLANLLDERDHSLPREWIQPVRGLVKYQQPRAVRKCLGELDELLHAKRVGVDLAVADFAKANVEERFVRAFERLF